ncbi:MAG: Crp/Fnr family transcriptional regulator [Rhodoferax sp.]
MPRLAPRTASCGAEACSSCCIRKAALFGDLSDGEYARVQWFIEQCEFVPGAALYDIGQPVKGIFVVRSGMVKMVRSTRDGRERIVRVLRVGDVVGLEALASAYYDCDAVALTPLSVCRVPLDIIKDLLARSPHLLAQVMQKWQKTLKDADDWLADLNSGSARLRVSNLVQKMRSPEDGEIAMLFSREEMGAMLDLKFETVSREVSRLVREGAIEPLDKLGRAYRVCKPEQLLQQ